MDGAVADHPLSALGHAWAGFRALGLASGGALVAAVALWAMAWNQLNPNTLVAQPISPAISLPDYAYLRS